MSAVLSVPPPPVGLFDSPRRVPTAHDRPDDGLAQSARTYLRWLIRQVAELTAWIDRCQAHQNELRRYHARRVLIAWDHDRRAEVETLAAGLARRPALVANRLRQSLQGFTWLVERWKALGRCLDADGGWTEAQITLAFNLLGIPSELRGADPWTTVGLDSPRALVDRELARLDDATRGRLEMLDREERALASKANPVVIPPALARVARQEAALLRRLQWVRAELDELAEPAQVNPPPLDDPFLDDDEDDEDDDPELPPSPPAPTPVRSQIPLDPIERDPIRPAPVYEGATSGGLVEALEPEFRPRNRRERLAARKLDRRDSRR